MGKVYKYTRKHWLKMVNRGVDPEWMLTCYDLEVVNDAEREHELLTEWQLTPTQIEANRKFWISMDDTKENAKPAAKTDVVSTPKSGGKRPFRSDTSSSKKKAQMARFVTLLGYNWMIRENTDGVFLIKRERSGDVNDLGTIYSRDYADEKVRRWFIKDPRDGSKEIELDGDSLDQLRRYKELAGEQDQLRYHPRIPNKIIPPIERRPRLTLPSSHNALTNALEEFGRKLDGLGLSGKKGEPVKKAFLDWMPGAYQKSRTVNPIKVWHEVTYRIMEQYHFELTDPDIGRLLADNANRFKHDKKRGIYSSVEGWMELDASDEE